MANWVDRYKQLISSSHRSSVIVADQDGLFEYAELCQAAQEAGYRILSAKSGLDVRLLFELEARNSKEKDLIVAPGDYSPLPDMLAVAHFQSIGLRNLFPHLDSKAIQGLSFNALYLLSNIKNYEELGREKTLKFLLENLYNVDFDTLTSSKSKERILNALITVFLEKNGINKPLTAFLTSLALPYFPELIEKGLTKNNLTDYLQTKWSAYLSTGELGVDFQDSVLNKSFGYLFVFDLLKPVKVSEERFGTLPKALRIGAFVDEGENNDNELAALIQYLEQQETSIEDLYDQWFTLAQVLAKAELRCLCSKNLSLKASLDQIIRRLNDRFQRFIDNSYSSLFSLSGVRRPVLVTRVLEYMRAQPDQRKALLVIDCMNYWQWLLLAKGLGEHGIKSTANTTMAFIPSITAWSRQALFRGRKPDLMDDNSKEATYFTEFWQAAGYYQNEIDFRRLGMHKPFAVNSLSDDTKILGMACNDLDDVMHSTVLGNEQLMTSTLQWVQQSGFVETIRSLRSKGFKIFVTADHGNVEATGIKNLKLKETTGSLSRSKRHIQFDNVTMLQNFKEQNPELPVGEKEHSIYLKHEEAFTDANKRVITHGGSHLWEILVPFCEIE